MASSSPVDTLMLPFLIRVCYFASFFAGMVQAACQFGPLGGTSGQTGNIVKFGQAVSKSIYPWGSDDGTHQAQAYVLLHGLLCYLAGNFMGGAWTNHDSRKTLKTAGEGLILTGILVLIIVFMCLPEKGLTNMKKDMHQLACFSMGLQNGVLVASTGYANTVTTSGTITDIGILIGGAITRSGRTADQMLKILTLCGLVLCFVSGSVVGGIVFYIGRSAHHERLGVAMAMLVPAFGLMGCCIISKMHSKSILSRSSTQRESLLPDASAENSPGKPAPAKPLSGQVKKNAKTRQPLVYGSCVACLCAGMIDVGAVLMIPESPTPTHVTGPSVKLGMGGAALIMGGTEKEKNRFITNLYLCLSFFAGTILAGMLTYKAERRTRFVGSLSLMFMSVMLIITVQINLLTHHDFTNELQHFCGLCMGFQNAVLCSITGFARSTHMTGNIANVGICLGQAVNPEKCNDALLFKLKANVVLTIAFIIGVVFEASVIAVFPGRMRWITIPAGILFILACVELVVERVHRPALLRRLAEEQNVSLKQVPRRTLVKARTAELHELKMLALAGGFTDAIAHVRSTRKKTLQLCLPIDVESVDENCASYIDMDEAHNDEWHGCGDIELRSDSHVSSRTV